MSIYDILTVDETASQQPGKPSQQGSHKVQRVAHGTAVSPGLGYPGLYIEIAFKSDSKTKRINPANAYTKDVIILASPCSTGMSEDFHTPKMSFYKDI